LIVSEVCKLFEEVWEAQRTLRDELEGRRKDRLRRSVGLLEEDLGGTGEVVSHELKVLDTWKESGEGRTKISSGTGNGGKEEKEEMKRTSSSPAVDTLWKKRKPSQLKPVYALVGTVLLT